MKNNSTLKHPKLGLGCFHLSDEGSRYPQKSRYIQISGSIYTNISIYPRMSMIYPENSRIYPGKLPDIHISKQISRKLTLVRYFFIASLIDFGVHRLLLGCDPVLQVCVAHYSHASLLF